VGRGQQKRDSDRRNVMTAREDKRSYDFDARDSRSENYSREEELSRMDDNVRYDRARDTEANRNELLKKRRIRD
jgi:hypothetical protein